MNELPNRARDLLSSSGAREESVRGHFPTTGDRSSFCGTVFKKKNIHTVTCTALGPETQSQTGVKEGKGTPGRRNSLWEGWQ